MLELEPGKINEPNFYWDKKLAEQLHSLSQNGELFFKKDEKDTLIISRLEMIEETRINLLTVDMSTEKHKDCSSLPGEISVEGTEISHEAKSEWSGWTLIRLVIFIKFDNEWTPHFLEIDPRDLTDAFFHLQSEEDMPATIFSISIYKILEKMEATCLSTDPERSKVVPYVLPISVVQQGLYKVFSKPSRRIRFINDTLMVCEIAIKEVIRYEKSDSGKQLNEWLYLKSVMIEALKSECIMSEKEIKILRNS